MFVIFDLVVYEELFDVLDMQKNAKRVLSVALVSFGSGFPLLFSSEIYKAWLLSQGGDIKSLIWISLFTLPYLLSWLWAPIIDYWVEKRSVSVKLIMSSIFLFASCLIAILPQYDPINDGAVVRVILGMLAFVCASQDHVVENYRQALLKVKERAVGVAYSMVMFRLSIMMAGAGGLIISDYAGWSHFFYVSALIMFLCAVSSLLLPSVKVAKKPGSFLSQYRISYQILRDLGSAPEKLSFLVGFRMSVFWHEAMIMVFLAQQVGYSYAEIGALQKLYGTAGLLLGGLLARYLLEFWGLKKTFSSILVAQIVVSLLFFTLNAAHISLTSWIGTMVVVECAVQGMLVTACSYWMMACCGSSGVTFTYALWNGVSMLGRVVVGPIATLCVLEKGWVTYFEVGVVLSVLSYIVGSVYFNSQSFTSVHSKVYQNL
ncbi:hypothetical protein MMH89_01600 [Candidatus Comchoanobacter bicostacola]|uniref:Muropeptide transporter n=1 Tax=Candidatus Comchoanobacter bicostacola TaxID=2919598 RepID=A0ABY5DKR5_9GAMM|nr:MFS transporter [Candidatus Comchoanobacter bicostacola]UTC24846.1 hypothetical protein MMH89_01600 [Candidatus Comchoanobacter bicostacola]